MQIYAPWWSCYVDQHNFKPTPLSDITAAIVAFLLVCCMAVVVAASCAGVTRMHVAWLLCWSVKTYTPMITLPHSMNVGVEIVHIRCLCKETSRCLLLICCCQIKLTYACREFNAFLICVRLSWRQLIQQPVVVNHFINWWKIDLTANGLFMIRKNGCQIS